VLEDNRGGELVILFHIEPQYPLATLREWRTWLLKTVPLVQSRPSN
jgi:hypothetical protein